MLSGGMGARKGIPWYIMWWHDSWEGDTLVCYMVAWELERDTLVCYLVAWELGKGYLGILCGGMVARRKRIE